MSDADEREWQRAEQRARDLAKTPPPMILSKSPIEEKRTPMRVSNPMRSPLVPPPRRRNPRSARYASVATWLVVAISAAIAAALFWYLGGS